MSFVTVDKPRPHVTLITLNRPERMNAMNLDASQDRFASRVQYRSISKIVFDDENQQYRLVTKAEK